MAVSTLTDEELGLVFCQVAWDTRRSVLPLVCQRWAALLAKPSGVWEGCELDPLPAFMPSTAVGPATRWFAQRAPALRCLHLRDGYDYVRWPDFEPADGSVEAFVLALLGMLSPHLVELKMSKMLRLSSLALYATLSSMRRLKKLQFLCESGHMVSASATELNELRYVSLLEHLELFTGSARWSNPDLDCFPTGLCCLTLLTNLSFIAKVDSYLAVPDAISCLKNLHSLSLCGFNVHTLPPSMSVLTKLADIMMWGSSLMVEGSFWNNPRSITSLQRLTSLHFQECGLSNVPAAVRGISSLKNLRLSQTRSGTMLLQIPEGAYLSALKSLRLAVSGARYVVDSLKLASHLTRLALRAGKVLLDSYAISVLLDDLPVLRQLDLTQQKWSETDQAFVQCVLGMYHRLQIEQPGRVLKITI